jgi:Glycine rich protein
MFLIRPTRVVPLVLSLGAALLFVGGSLIVAPSEAGASIPLGSAFTVGLTGAPVTYTTPSNTCSLLVQAQGGQGGQGEDNDGPFGVGGQGGFVDVVFPVGGTSTVTLNVGGGGQGGNYDTWYADHQTYHGGYNGGGQGGHTTNDSEAGGGGGGETTVSINGSLVVVAAGGGGGGTRYGGSGTAGDGGAGGTSVVPTGTAGVTGGYGAGGGAGTPSAGGAGGSDDGYGSGTGGAGSANTGGNAANGSDFAGGGGGAGYFGGGAGSGSSGGGGGSSWVASGALAPNDGSSVANAPIQSEAWNGPNGGNGSVTLVAQPCPPVTGLTITGASDSITATWSPVASYMGNTVSYVCTLMAAFNTPLGFTEVTSSPSCAFSEVNAARNFGIAVTALQGTIPGAPVTVFASPPLPPIESSDGSVATTTTVPASPTTTSTVTSTTTTLPVKSISCTRTSPKRTIVVRGTAPRCPSGYKLTK